MHYYTVVLPTRPVVMPHRLALAELPKMSVSMADMLNPLLMNLGSVEDLDAAGDPNAVRDYLNDIFYEQSGNAIVANGTVDGVFLSEPIWTDLVGLITDIYRVILTHRAVLLMGPPHGFIHSISFRCWIGYDMEVMVGVVHYHPPSNQ